ncbi:hypothetical protein BT69DRAFT_1350608 [Atractiella rhizophila]|nr:hypothetical protein BT69DRAFT_1350608 [Atractiella rhizophila]
MLPLLLLPALAASSPLRSTPSTSSGKLAPLYVPPPPSVGGFSHGEIALFANAHSNSTSHLVPNGYIVKLAKGACPHKHRQLLGMIRAEEKNWMGHLASQGVLSFENELEGLEKVVNVGKKWVGLTGKWSDRELEKIRALEGVEYVERDSIVVTREVDSDLDDKYKRDQQKFATWVWSSPNFAPCQNWLPDLHLRLLLHPDPSGVNAYIIDTGVNIDHVELEGRAEWGKTMPKNDVDQDANGHGSHVAGTVASNRYGVAKSAHIIAVKVLGSNGQGTMSDVIGGVEWAVNDMETRKSKKGYKGSVANMSLGGGKSQALDDVVDAAVGEGMHFAVAAGNDNRDACGYSPAAAKEAITVGASTSKDEIAYFSNHGKCVDVFAPGLNILSIWNTGNRSINTISGTSMASPHVAGLVAYFLSVYPEKFSPSAEDFEDSVYDAILHPSFGSPFQWAKDFVLSLFGPHLNILVGREEKLAPVPIKELSPKVLKNVLLKLSTKDALSGLPANTPNLLIYNNFTFASA